MANLKYSYDKDSTKTRTVLRVSCPKGAALAYSAAQMLKQGTRAPFLRFDYAEGKTLLLFFDVTECVPLRRFLKAVVSEAQFLALLCDVRDASAFCEEQGLSAEQVVFDERYAYKAEDGFRFAYVPASVPTGVSVLRFLEGVAAKARFSSSEEARTRDLLADWLRRQSVFSLYEFDSFLAQLSQTPHAGLLNLRLAGVQEAARFPKGADGEGAAAADLFEPLGFATEGARDGEARAVNTRFRVPTARDEMLDAPEALLRAERLLEKVLCAPESKGGAVRRDFFYPAPRFVRAVESKEYAVDPPPQKPVEDDTPVAMKIVPSLVMAFASLSSAAVMASMILGQGGSWVRAVPMAVMAVSLLVGSVLWPVLSRRMEKRRRCQAEERRKARYASYLDKVRHELEAEAARERAVLGEERERLSALLRRLAAMDPGLMGRTPMHGDFLALRIGVGSEKLVAKVVWPKERFAVERDELEEMVLAASREPLEISDVPRVISLRKTRVVGVVGHEGRVLPFVRGLAVQAACLHTYQDVKLAFFNDPESCDVWEWAYGIPHTFSEARDVHYFTRTAEDSSELEMMFERILQERLDVQCKGRPLPHFLVVVTAPALATKAGALGGLCEAAAAADLGFSIVVAARHMRELPKHTQAVVDLSPSGEGGHRATLFVNGAASQAVEGLMPDIFLEEPAARKAALRLTDVRLDVSSQEGALPESLALFDMMRMGRVEDFDFAAAWKASDASTSLAACVGAGADGSPFVLNLHERFHGPHGLVAGTTGSGKSEFIITWILSMCATYSPDEVAFVLIDYKGGGLASGFDNDRMRLPHLQGTITNLDGGAISRSLVSIASELKRRQDLFNRAREVSGGDSVDIYGYLRLYRQGKVSDACPHLFIVADEFAELKDQEPEFMDELISTARIGRSLGVHLVLATQKPDGVVNQQIWSNARFKVCLKVAEPADSKAMIGREDAAEITRAGRFYLLVGYNEHFAQGQAAYAGAGYVPRDVWQGERDDRLAVVTATGRVVDSVRPKEVLPEGVPQRTQQVALLQALEAAARKAGFPRRQLWLDEVPPHPVYAEERRRFVDAGMLEDEPCDPYVLSPFVGIVDDPVERAQTPLRLALSEKGNVLLYGSPGSGKSAVVATMLADLVTHASPEELNVYVVDFGAETLGAFKTAPHVGDVLGIGDAEKVDNLFKLLCHELDSRRALFGGAATSLSQYVRRTGDGIPSIVAVINNYSTFSELFEHLEQDMVRLTREGSRYGMHFVVTATSASAVRMRLSANFKQVLALELANESDYGAVFGRFGRRSVPRGVGRGLVGCGPRGLLEFQTCFIDTPGSDPYDAAVRYAEAISASTECRASAESVPVLPEVVRTSHVLGPRASAAAFPLGIRASNLQVFSRDYERQGLELMCAAQPFGAVGVFEELCEVASRIDGMGAAVFDCDGMMEGACPDVPRIDVFSLKGFLSDADAPGHALLIVTGLAKFMHDVGATLPDGQKGALEAAKGAMRGAIVQGPPRKRLTILVFVPSLDLVKIQNEAWGQKLISSRSFIWIGDGMQNQSVLRVRNGYAVAKENAGEGSAFLVVKGNPELVKLVSSEEGFSD